MKKSVLYYPVISGRAFSPVCIALLPLLFSSVAASETQSGENNDEIIVTAKPAQSPAGKIDGYIATRSVSATKTDTPLIETPQSVTVLTRDEMTAHNAQSVSEALRYTAGVLQTNDAASSRFDNLSIRGFNITSTGMLRDGLRSTTAQA
ncbi:TonB-dependent receptor plug domain-containing protein [Morganella sp. Je.2.23]